MNIKTSTIILICGVLSAAAAAVISYGAGTMTLSGAGALVVAMGCLNLHETVSAREAQTDHLHARIRALERALAPFATLTIDSRSPASKKAQAAYPTLAQTTLNARRILGVPDFMPGEPEE